MKRCIFKKTNLYFEVDYDYERSACHCDEPYVCRCTTIEHAWINNINVHKVVDELYREHSKTDSYIDEYCFDRICHAFRIYDKDSYEIDIGAGYYGEEVYGVYFEDEEKIFNAYHEMLALNTPLEKIQYCLKLEYGYLIDCVESLAYASIIEVSPNDIRLPQTEYFIKLENKVIEDYKNRELPIAVCVKDGNKYRLIDGYHRFVANKDRNSVYIVVLE